MFYKNIGQYHAEKFIVPFSIYYLKKRVRFSTIKTACPIESTILNISLNRYKKNGHNRSLIILGS
jgi:hypothetical protein